MIMFWDLKVKVTRVNKCIFHTNVRSITQKRMIPKCSKLILGMTLGYPGVVWSWVERSKVNVKIT